MHEGASRASQLYDGMVQVPVNVHLSLLRWRLDPDVYAISGTYDPPEAVYCIKCLQKLWPLHLLQ